MITKVLPSAKLPNIKGSPATRQKIAEDFHTKFLKELNQTYKSYGNVQTEDIKDIFSKLVPNIDIKVEQIQLKDGPRGQIINKFNHSGQATSYLLKIPTITNHSILKGDKFNTISHECSHFLKTITEPKYLAQCFPKELSIYKQKRLNDFYAKNLYGSNAIAKTVTPDEIKTFFDKEKFTSKERLKTIKIWIRDLCDESNAAKKGEITEVDFKYPLKDLTQNLDGFHFPTLTENVGNKCFTYYPEFYDTKEEKINHLKAFIDTIKQEKCKLVIDKILRIPQKIEVLKNSFIETSIVRQTEIKKEIQTKNNSFIHKLFSFFNT